MSEDEVVKPLTVRRESLASKAKRLAESMRHEKRRCGHPNHPTTFIDNEGKCEKAWKCKDRGEKGCLAKGEAKP